MFHESSPTDACSDDERVLETHNGRVIDINLFVTLSLEDRMPTQKRVPAETSPVQDQHDLISDLPSVGPAFVPKRVLQRKEAFRLAGEKRLRSQGKAPRTN